MTWMRVATAAVLIPCVVGLVLWGSTAVVAVGLALVILLALFEYFAIGDAIGHRAYRFWAGACTLLLVFVQWWAVYLNQPGNLGMPRRWTPGDQSLGHGIQYLLRSSPTVADVFFLFLLGIAALTQIGRAHV